LIRTTIELTIEDIELILDNLGVEEAGEHHNKTALRNKLREILLGLRERNMKRDVA
jgi:hypothetical protein